MFTKIFKGAFYIVIMKPDGSNEKVLFKSYLAENPSWSPSGKEIIFSFKKTKSSKSRLKIVSIKGSEIRDVETSDEALDPYWFVP